MIALFRFFNALEVGIQVLSVGPCRTVDSLQLLIARVAAPIGTGNTRQFERFDRRSARHVRAAAKIDPVALAIKRYFFFRDSFDNLDFVGLAHPSE